MSLKKKRKVENSLKVFFLGKVICSLEFDPRLFVKVDCVDFQRSHIYLPSFQEVTWVPLLG